MTSEDIRKSIVPAGWRGRAVYVPLTIAGYPHCFVSVRTAIRAGVTGLKKCPVMGTYSGQWPRVA